MFEKKFRRGQMKNSKLTNEQLLVDESLQFVGNGYLGLRGNFEEGYPSDFQTIRGTYINGFYEDVEIKYGESAYGFPKTAQKMLNLIDGQTIILRIDDEEFSLFDGKVVMLERKLNIMEGYNVRHIEWISPKGHHLVIRIRKMASFEQLELAVIEYMITSMNYSGDISILSTLNGHVNNYADKNDPRVSSERERWLLVEQVHVENNALGQITSKTRHSNLFVTASMSHDIDMDYEVQEESVVAFKHASIKQGESLTFSKFLVYTDSIRTPVYEESGRQIIHKAIQHSSAYWFSQQKKHLETFWEVARIELEGDESVEEALNYSVYQLYASAGRDKFSNICAKGLSGEGYEGHYFWDTEIYMLPFFSLTHPKIAKNLLAFRYQTLNQARERSVMMGHKTGAKIPWRTIAGTECSAYFPAGSAQYHINADVAYAYIQYYLFTKDIDFVKQAGFEVIFETARIWLEIGHFDKDNQFKIPAVTGPDEYSAIVNNNFYTNAMARYHLYWATKFADELNITDPDWFQEYKKRLQIKNEELQMMEKAYQQMYLPFSEELGIFWQDDSFKDKADWDFEHTPKDKYPLLLHYHPLTIYRYRVLKQADTLLAYFLLDNVPLDIMERSYDYYERLTTHDSSLSPCVHSIMAAKLNRVEKAYMFFMKTVRLDLDNLHHNTKDGLHIANAGGAYMSIVYGFGGLRIKEDGISLHPIMPREWKKLRFRFRYQQALVTITMADQITLHTTKPVEIIVYGQRYSVENQIHIRYPMEAK